MDPKELKTRFDRRQQGIAEKKQAAEESGEAARQEAEARRSAASETLRDVVYPYLLAVQKEIGRDKFSVDVSRSEQDEFVGVNFRIKDGSTYEISRDPLGNVQIREHKAGLAAYDPGRPLQGYTVSGNQDLTPDTIGQLVQIAIDRTE